METTKRLRKRGNRTMELGFLMSCLLELLAARLEIIGIRYRWHGIRFDIVAWQPVLEQTVLVEAKYRADGRLIRPSEIKRFHAEIMSVARAEKVYANNALFMTNTGFSEGALEAARSYGIRTVARVPVRFHAPVPRRKSQRLRGRDASLPGR